MYGIGPALVLIDIKKAFEMASPIVVLQVLANAGIGGKMLAWLRDFLADRSGRVKFQNACSTTKNFHNGTPQGSCLSPTLFSYVINHLLNLRFPQTVQLVAYADDLALSCVHYDKDKVHLICLRSSTYRSSKYWPEVFTS